ncbi:MAG: FCD domain-containing protein [Actinomycetota bacterium]|nr:FCD domain-containing protein [Actinomycetota bacterium]
MSVATGDPLQRLLEQTVYTPVRRGSAVAETVGRLGHAIGMGLLRPGDRLPPEGRLANDLGISAVTLRSALAILRSAGTLETRRGRAGGTYVSADPSADGVLVHEPLPSEDELRDLVDYRGVVEGGAAWLAAERATAEQIEYLDALVAEMETVRGFDPWSERDTLFHLILADAAGSPRLVEQVAGIRAEVYRLAKLGSVPEPVVELADREHREILRAVAARRPTRARDAMVRHVASTGALWLGLGRVADNADRTERGGDDGR